MFQSVDITLCFLFKYLFMLATVYSLCKQTVLIRDHYCCIPVMISDRKSKLFSLHSHTQVFFLNKCSTFICFLYCFVAYNDRDNDSDISNLQRIDPIHWLIALLYLESVNDWLNWAACPWVFSSLDRCHGFRGEKSTDSSLPPALQM